MLKKKKSQLLGFYVYQEVSCKRFIFFMKYFNMLNLGCSTMYDERWGCILIVGKVLAGVHCGEIAALRLAEPYG